MTKYNLQVSQKAKERRERAAKLRAQGWTLDRIGKELGGISRQRVHSLLREASPLDAALHAVTIAKVSPAMTASLTLADVIKASE